MVDHGIVAGGTRRYHQWVTDLPAHHQLIIDRLCEPLDTTARDQALAAAKPGQRVVAFAGRAGGEGADPESIRVLKERETGGQMLVAVVWTDGEGRPKHGVFTLTRSSEGAWQGGVGGSGGVGPVLRGRPWLNAGAGGRPFYIYGQVVEGPNVARVRVTFERTLILEDEPDVNGIVLFPTDQDQPNGWQEGGIAELFDAEARLVARHRLFGKADPLPTS